jgi:hypothetical protein
VLQQLALLAIPCLIVCALLFLVVERPFMKPDWPKRLRARVWPARRAVEAPQPAKAETP